MATTEELQGEELEAVLDQLQRRIDRLRVLYEQFFLGIEKTPPVQVQKDVVRTIHRLQKAKIHGAAGKFRMQALIQRFNAHKSYWARTMRDIEEGKHRRQTFRAEQRRRDIDRPVDVLTMEDYLAINLVRDTQGEEAARAAEEERRRRREAELAEAEAEASGELDRMDDEPLAMPSTQPPLGRAAASGAHPAASSGAHAATSSGAHAAAGSGGAPRGPTDIRGTSAEEIARKAERLREMRERMAGGSAASRARDRARDRLPTGAPGEHAPSAPAPAPGPRDVDREVFDKFIAVRRSLNQSTDRLSFESVKSSLEKQRAKVRAKHDCARVDFDVVVKDGAAFLKPIPVKDA